MPPKYNQFKAMLAITKASFRAILRSPSAIVISIFFPLIFILVFGFIGNSGGPSYRVVLGANSDTNNVIWHSLQATKGIRFVNYDNVEELNTDLNKGRITGVLTIHKKSAADTSAHYRIDFRSTTASADKVATFLPLLENTVDHIDRATFKDQQSIAQIVPNIQQVREYRTIDFILPGQLGFSLMSASIFGVA